MLTLTRVFIPCSLIVPSQLRCRPKTICVNSRINALTTDSADTNNTRRWKFKSPARSPFSFSFGIKSDRISRKYSRAASMFTTIGPGRLSNRRFALVSFVYALDGEPGKRLGIYLFRCEIRFQFTVQHSAEAVAFHLLEQLARRVAFPFPKPFDPFIKRA